jgi:hypothetical protein
MTESVRIPADVDRPDRLVAGLAARQLAILAAAGLVLAGAWAATRAWLPAPVFIVAAAPAASVAVVLAIGRRDGLPADRLALAALRHARSNRRLVPAPEGIPALPAGLPPIALPASLDLPVDGVGADGTLDLGDAGVALICKASSINFGLRTGAEQKAVVAAFGRWLNSLTEPIQILVRAERVDVAAAVAGLHHGASTLASVELERAAIDHARFLADLAARRDVLRRSVLVVFRAERSGAREDLARRAADAAASLGAAGITLAALPEPEARAVLAHAMCAETLSTAPSGTDVVKGVWG